MPSKYLDPGLIHQCNDMHVQSRGLEIQGYPEIPGIYNGIYE
jgi:hypothetical protein